MIDYLIVGQGLAGTVLAHLLLKNGKNVLVIDAIHPSSSSKIAAGIFNPVTGRRVVKSWMADTLIPFAHTYYKSLEIELEDIFYFPMDVIEIVQNVKDRNEWEGRMSDPGMKNYLVGNTPDQLYEEAVHPYEKLFRISNSGWLNISKLIHLFKQKLIESGKLLELFMDYSLIKVNKDKILCGNIECRNIIFCDGYNVRNNLFWNQLPLVPAKGEILTITCKNLPEDFILMSGIFILPIGNKLFRVGATYEWDFFDEQPSEKGMKDLLERLNRILKLPYEIVDHNAGIRPTVKDRRPLLGRHHEYENVFVFNGLGTKGVQLAPYFAKMFVEFLDGKDLLNEVNVARFTN